MSTWDETSIGHAGLETPHVTFTSSRLLRLCCGSFTKVEVLLTRFPTRQIHIVTTVTMLFFSFNSR